DSAFEAQFSVEQPRTAVVAVDIDPELVRSAAVTYDKGETWRNLCQKDIAEPTGVIEPGFRSHIEDRHTFA
ncbi:unnamed protein product, partial [marine sediment metagenome]